MDYQININHQFSAVSESEARKKAQQYIAGNLALKPINDSLLSPRQVSDQCDSFRSKKKEHFCIFFLNTQNQIIGREIISIGTLNASLVHARECFRTAIVKNCCSIVLAHNHPSGSLEPSAEDLSVTKRLVDAGRLLGIEVQDHVIVTAQAYTSFKEQRLI
jgi:DNA repair protein RadC